MERKTLTKEVLQQLQQQGYVTLIAKGAPEETDGEFTQVLLASKEEMHTEETAEATWQTAVADASFLDNAKVKYVIES